MWISRNRRLVTLSDLVEAPVEMHSLYLRPDRCPALWAEPAVLAAAPCSPRPSVTCPIRR